MKLVAAIAVAGQTTVFVGTVTVGKHLTVMFAVVELTQLLFDTTVKFAVKLPQVA